MAGAATAESTDTTRYFILLCEHTDDRQTWQAGSLWQETDPIGDGRELQLDCPVPGEGPAAHAGSLRVACSHVSQLTAEMLSLLVAVKESQHRLMLFSDAAWFREGIELQTGDPVHVTRQDSRLAGTVRYKGPIPKNSGMWFGVQLTDRYAGEGTTNGFFQGKSFFTCDEDCAVFVSLSKIRRSGDDDDNDDDVAGDTPAMQLALSERVTWWNDSGPSKATVRWFGYLPNEMGYELIAGVEFDEPVGKGTGRFRGRHIFHTRKGHASLIPISGLIREGVMSFDDLTCDTGTVAKKPDIVNAHVEQEPQATGSGDHRLETGSRVEVLHNPVRRGVIRWIGELQEGGRTIAGLEMVDEDPSCYTRGTFGGRQIFLCPGQRAFFVSLSKCRPDSQTADRPPHQLSVVDAFCGRRRGIHGSASSCHMDVVLFVMFVFRGPFDDLLEQPNAVGDDSTTSDHAACRKMLKVVVDSLRTQYYVDNDTTTKLHQAMNRICPSVCVDRKEPDPGQFLSFVCRDVLKTSPFVTLGTGQTEYVYQLVSSANTEATNTPTVQHLFEESLLLQPDTKLYSVASTLILRMPQGSNDATRGRVLPSLHLNVANIAVEVATSEKGPLLELFAIVTVDGPRCTSFVKPEKGSELPWLVFETAPEAEPSVPVIRRCPDIVKWLSEERRPSLVSQTSGVPSEICSIISNTSLCFYRFLQDTQPIYVSLIR